MSSNPSPAALEDLQVYASRQNQLIDSLSREPYCPYKSYFLRVEDNEWVDLWKSTWGVDVDSFDGVEKVERGPDPVDNSLIPDVVPETCEVEAVPAALRKCWSQMESAKTLIRGEYKEAEKCAVTTCGDTDWYKVLMICGQPGIGKSTFLVRLLLRRLALKLPTVLQVASHEPMLFSEQGVKKFSRPDNGAIYLRLLPVGSTNASRIWALVDPSVHLQQPASIFTAGPFFVVEAAIPSPERTQWTYRVASKTFYMKLWSFSEVLQARCLNGPQRNWKSEKMLWHLHSTYGASPRSLFMAATTSDLYRRRVSVEIGKISKQALTRLIQFTEDATSDSHLVVSVGPSPSNRFRAERRIVSSYVLAECCKQILGDRADDVRQLYDVLRNYPVTFAAAGDVFEFRVHRFLLHGPLLQLFPILGHGSNEGKNIAYGDYTATLNQAGREELSLSNLEEHIVTHETHPSPQYDTYYRPPNTNFPAIDAWALVQPDPEEPPIFMTFQITINKTSHDAKRKGLEMVDALDIPDDARRFLVVITPKGITPKITVPVDYMEAKFGVADAKHFQVFHCPVDVDAVFGSTGL